MDDFKVKPCGLPYSCPLYDENRFFVETHERFLGDRVSVYPLLGVTRKVWCDGHAARGLPGQLTACRRALARVADLVVKARGNRIAFLTAALKRELEERERESFRVSPAARADRRSELLKQGAPF